MKQPPKIPTFDTLLGAIRVAPSAADLALLRVTVRTHFMGAQREALEAAAAKREGELPNGEALGR